jgi:hypothetical protein
MKDNIITVLRKKGFGAVDCICWVYLNYNRDKLRALVNTVINLWVL